MKFNLMKTASVTMERVETFSSNEMREGTNPEGEERRGLTNLQAADKHRGEEEQRIREWERCLLGGQSEKLSSRICRLWSDFDLKHELLNPEHHSTCEEEEGEEEDEEDWTRPKLNPECKTGKLDRLKTNPLTKTLIWAQS